MYQITTYKWGTPTFRGLLLIAQQSPELFKGNKPTKTRYSVSVVMSDWCVYGVSLLFFEYFDILFGCCSCSAVTADELNYLTIHSN